ncbi:MAG: HAD-superfamily hydrolase, subfamily [Frankiales bacterium]|nr:HAD-superfamily hydrolase, subfamily [Frankiales bacterium]
MTLPVPTIFFSDLDGTLLDDDGSVHPDTVQAFRELAAQGARIVLASGRIPRTMAAVCEALDLEGPQITMNGALVCSPLTGEIVHGYPLEEAAVREHLAFARDRGLPAVLAHPDGYAAPDVEPLRNAIPAELLTEVTDLDQLAGSRPFKTYLLTGRQRFQAVLAEAYEVFEGRYHVTSGGADDSVELLDLHANKGSAATALATRLGVPMADVAAAGDGLNDVELLRAAGVSIAMHEAPQDVRMAASCIAPPRSEGGLVRAVEQLFAISPSPLEQPCSDPDLKGAPR